MSSQLLQLQIAILPQETTPPLLGAHAATDEDDHSNVSMAILWYRLASYSSYIDIEIMSRSLGGRLIMRYRDVFGYNLHTVLTNNDASLFLFLVSTTGRPDWPHHQKWHASSRHRILIEQHRIRIAIVTEERTFDYEGQRRSSHKISPISVESECRLCHKSRIIQLYYHFYHNNICWWRFHPLSLFWVLMWEFFPYLC